MVFDIILKSLNHLRHVMMSDPLSKSSPSKYLFLSNHFDIFNTVGMTKSFLCYKFKQEITHRILLLHFVNLSHCSRKRHRLISKEFRIHASNVTFYTSYICLHISRKWSIPIQLIVRDSIHLNVMLPLGRIHYSQSMLILF